MTKILLVEDDKSLREIYGVRLLAEGYDIVSAGDGEEALAMAIKERPALIVSDVMMPKISGFDMLDILRSTTETRDIKVIMMTALSSEDQRQRGEALGAERYLVKSQVGIEDVVRTVHEVLGDSPAAQQASAVPQTPVNPAPFAPPQPAQVPQATPAPQPVQPASSLPQPTDQPAEQTRPSIAELSPQQPAAQPVMPTQLPQPLPSAPQTPVNPAPFAPPQPVQVPQATPAPQPVQPASSLPQPTAPFSSAAPRPSNLGDRVIHPLEPIDQGQADIAKMMEQELSGNLPQEPQQPHAE